jgi:hypothetical protein
MRLIAAVIFLMNLAAPAFASNTQDGQADLSSTVGESTTKPAKKAEGDCGKACRGKTQEFISGLLDKVSPPENSNTAKPASSN